MLEKIKKYFKSKKILLIIFVFIVIIFCVFYYLFYAISSNERYLLVRNPIGSRVLANWHSLRKIVNLVHLPYWFKESKLEIYHINISPSELNEMNSHKPLDESRLHYGKMTDDYKYYVKADFTSPTHDYSDKIKIRYRGWSINNWDGEKQAYRIKFPKDNLFQGKRGLNFFLPYDRSYFGEALASYRAQKFGITSAQFKYARVVINGRDSGVYLVSEPFSKELLARSGMVDANNVFTTKDILCEEIETIYSEKFLSNWKSFTAEEEESYFEELEVLLRLIDKADDEEFIEKIGSIYNLEKFYDWMIINVLQSSNHQGDGGNAVLIFRKETGLFEHIPWDVRLSKSSQFDMNRQNILARRILSQQKFYDNFIKKLREYVSDESNLKDDLDFFDNLYAELKGEFYKDQAKLHNDFMFDKSIKVLRANIIDSFANAKEIVEFKSTPLKLVQAYRQSESEINFNGSFSRFNDLFLDIDEFVKKNPQFKKYDDNSLLLSAGRHIFNKIVILPKDIKLYIKPGAELLFDEKVSLVIYGPVEAIGTHERPIIMKSVKKPWGSFAVINFGEEKSIFSHITVSGGSSDLINGVVITSQFSLHNSDAEVAHSVFENSQSDDAFHAILGSVQINNSVFRNNNADGIDVDFVNNSSIINCEFINEKEEDSNGDAIDVSGVSSFVIENNIINGYGDKCISIGEKSNLTVKNNILDSCSIGIAVKDDSYAMLKNNFLINNKQNGIALYKKKPEFIVGGKVDAINLILWNNKEEIFIDDYSVYENEIDDNIDYNKKNIYKLMNEILPDLMQDSILEKYEI